MTLVMGTNIETRFHSSFRNVRILFETPNADSSTQDNTLRQMKQTSDPHVKKLEPSSRNPSQATAKPGTDVGGLARETFEEMTWSCFNTRNQQIQAAKGNQHLHG